MRTRYKQKLINSARQLFQALPSPIAQAVIFAVRGITSRIAPVPAYDVARDVSVTTLQSEGYQTFFGYYDVSPHDVAGRRILASRTSDLASGRAMASPLAVGYFEIDGATNPFRPIDETSTWCWQQGCRLQWVDPLGPDTVIYNRPVAGSHGAVIQDVQTGRQVHQLTSPVYAMHPDGKAAVSLNFSRLQRLRPGYGYDDIPDHTQGDLAPKSDGLWHVDLATGRRELLMSLATAAALAPHATMRGAEHYFNHAQWNPGGTRLLVFHIWQAAGHRWRRALTLGCQGERPFIVTAGDSVSHYCWLNDEDLLLTSTRMDQEAGYHVFRDGMGHMAAWPRDLLPLDGHPSQSPQGRWILSDSTANMRGQRSLFLFDPETRTRINIGTFSTPDRLRGENRCDLHPRWSRDGRHVSIDISHDGLRHMMLLDVSRIVIPGHSAT